LFLQEDIDVSKCVYQEIGSVIDTDGWATTWIGGLALSRYILDNPEIVRRKIVCDFCSGSGLVGIAAKIAGASKVICVDHDPLSHIAMNLNAMANHVDIEIHSDIRDHEILLSGDPWFVNNENMEDYFFKNEYTYIGRPIRTPGLPSYYNPVASYFINSVEYPTGSECFIWKSK
jgi:predicted nicotinamide N-methyase